MGTGSVRAGTSRFRGLSDCSCSISNSPCMASQRRVNQVCWSAVVLHPAPSTSGTQPPTSTASSPWAARRPQTSRSNNRAAWTCSLGFGISWKKFRPPEVVRSFLTSSGLALKTKVELERRNDRNAVEFLLVKENTLIPRRDDLHICAGLGRSQPDSLSEFGRIALPVCLGAIIAHHRREPPRAGGASEGERANMLAGEVGHLTFGVSQGRQSKILGRSRRRPQTAAQSASSLSGWVSWIPSAVSFAHAKDSFNPQVWRDLTAFMETARRKKKASPPRFARRTNTIEPRRSL